jgi:hypothetical protein
VDAFDDPGVGAPPVLDPQPDPEPAPIELLSAQTVAETLFGSSVMSYQVKEVFEQRFGGKTVQWSGVLTSVTHYPFDRVFGNAPGTRAVIEVQGRIKAFVQLESEALNKLRSKTGKPVVFEGKLLACDGFMNSIFVGEGRILWNGGE